MERPHKGQWRGYTISAEGGVGTKVGGGLERYQGHQAISDASWRSMDEKTPSMAGSRRLQVEMDRTLWGFYGRACVGCGR